MRTPGSGMKAIQRAIMLLLVIIMAQLGAHAQTSTPLRRPISPEKPMWLIHIDTWNYADPQKIIALIPPDIRPFVVMNISLSISHNETTSQFQVAEYGYEVARSWLRACAENRMWAMVQPSSGGFSQFSDFDLSVYEEFFRDYPNMLGFNYCEQFWGYDSPTDPLSANWTDRIAHFANLLQLSNRYGGYLVVSWCGNQWSPNINPIAMLKRIPAFAAACRNYTENYILCEKYTQQSYQSDMESVCLGSWLSGYAGQYGMRYDDTGWTDTAGLHENFTMATQGAPFLEHVMLTGQTVFDGPELIWTQCFREIGSGSTTNGYTTRRWETFPQFDNVSMDLFRKVVDGTVRIPSRKEVIDRTKVVIVNNVNSGGADTIYSSPDTLFEGLYRMDGDGNLLNNKTFFKKTGRYPTIPTVYQLDDADANSFQVKVNRSAYSIRWPTVTSKVTEFNTLFPQETTGDLYAGRHENGWVVYNPYKTGQAASGNIRFKYNTCEGMDLTLSQYTAGVVKEFSDRVTIYLSNYDNVLNTGLKTDTIVIRGASSEPTWTYAERGSHQASGITKSWSGGVFTLTVQHNGPLDITVNCAGSATGRLTAFIPSAVTAPDPPMAFAGPRQYEAECFDYKSIAGITKGGQNGAIRNYSGQGYLQLGTNAAASVRDTVSVLKAGSYRLLTKYSVEGGSVSNVDLYVNGARVTAPLFAQTPTFSDWAVHQQNVILIAGQNTIEFRATATGARTMYFDNIVLVPMAYGSGVVIQENEPGFAGVEGMIATNSANFTGSGYADTNDAAGAGIHWEVFLDASVTKAFTFRYAGTSAVTANLIVDAVTMISNIQFPSTGSLSNWGFVTVYANPAAGFANLRLQAVSATGLPNVDYLEVIGGSATPVQTKEPVADAHVRDGADSGSNFGSAIELAVKNSGTSASGFNRNTFLKFDVSSLGDAQSVKLKLTPSKVDGAATLAYQRVTDDSWTEAAINWNNQPAASGTAVADLGGYAVGQAVEIDVTDLAKTEAAGDGILSLRISDPGAANIFIGFSSRESATAGVRPVLEYLMPPSAPTGLAAGAGSGQATLTWIPSATATGYSVKRSTSPGGPYTVVANELTTTSYLDIGLTNQLTYYYVVSALGAGSESENSAEVSVIPGLSKKVYLRFDDVAGTIATDSSNHGWNGTLVNNPAWVSGDSAKISGALKLTGAGSDHVTLPEGIVSDLTDFTISFWLNPNSLATWSRVFDFSTGTTQNSMYFTPQTAGGLIRFGLRVNGNAQNLEAPGGVQFTPGTWSHVAVTLSGSTATLYLNGAAVATSTTMTNEPTALGNTTVNTIGKSSSSDPYLDATVDEFMIHGFALGAADVAILATAPPVITSATAAVGTVGSPFFYQAAASNNPTGYSAAGLPAGLSINSGTGEISGNPGVSGVFPITLGATNLGGTGTATLNLTVISPPITEEELRAPQIELAGGNANLKTAISVIGHTYQLQYSDDLAAGQWLDHGVAQAGTGGPLEFIIPAGPPVGRRFYRLLIYQP